MAKQVAGAHHSAKLTEDDVRAIKRLRGGCSECGSVPSMEALGRRFGVSTVAIFNVVNGRSWGSVK